MLSDEKISHLSHLIVAALLAHDDIDSAEDDSVLRRSVKRAIGRFVNKATAMDEAVRKKIQSLSRPVVEGTGEWDILYQKYFKEEETKRGFQNRS